MLSHQARLFAYHIDERKFDFDEAVAEVREHPTNPQLWGLKNLSTFKWRARVRDAVHEIEPGRSITISTGLRIDFGRIEGEIVS
ncbi:MAG: hypothetical protein M3256_28210 [Actinomycetota bacterium]|nr:hypothetical protein [Actinomycetota bacterium]